MKFLLKQYSRLKDERGQDLVEYVLVVALIAFGAVAAMKSLSSEINVAFNTISSNLSVNLQPQDGGGHK